MNFQDYIKTEFLVMVPVLYFIGLSLKKSPFPNKRIPLALGVIGVALCCIWAFSTIDTLSLQNVLSALFTALTQGILSAGTTVYVNQLYIQSRKEE